MDYYVEWVHGVVEMGTPYTLRAVGKDVQTPFDITLVVACAIKAQRFAAAGRYCVLPAMQPNGGASPQGLSNLKIFRQTPSDVGVHFIAVGPSMPNNLNGD